MSRQGRISPDNDNCTRDIHLKKGTLQDCLSLGDQVTPLALAAVTAVAALLAAGAPAALARNDAVATSDASLEVQQAYDRYSSSYDELDGGAAAEALGFPQLRRALLQEARGRVLEVAVGTGLNLPLYTWEAAQQVPERLQPPPQQQQSHGQPDPLQQGRAQEEGREPAGAAGNATNEVAAGGVTSLDAVDLSPGMLAQARRRVDASPALSGRPIAFTQADVASLPFPDGSFDSVVDTFSLCVFPDPQAALNEMARVVSPGGRVLLVEHARSDNPLLAAYQDATAAPVAALGKGCVWNQDVEAMVGRAGLKVLRGQRSAAGTVELLVAARR